jgi:TolC family type I secretion outer membrane protein
MKVTTALVAGALLVLAAPVQSPRPAAAETLAEAFAAAYVNNPTLVAERAALRAVDEEVPQALSGWRPTVTVTGQGGKEGADTSSPFFTRKETRTPRSLALNLSQPLYRGGRTVAGMRQAETRVLAARERLRATEQVVLLAVVTAYMDVLRDQAVVELDRNNERVLRRQYQATQDRFEVGELTRTDIAQAEARLSRATSDRISAEGNLVASRSTYKRVVGVAPGTLELAPPYGDLPQSEQEALTIAEAENPSLVAARYDEQAAGHAVRVVTGSLLPTLSLDGAASRAEDTGSNGSKSDVAGIVARLSVPLYQSGSVWSQARQARETRNELRIRIDESRQEVFDEVTQAWEALQTARARIQSDGAQVRANEIALEGVHEETTVGARTVLDVLDAEQELLDARVALVRAQRDEYVAAYRLKQAIGRLLAQNLGLAIEIYDPGSHYQAVRNKLFGFGD